MREPQVVNTLTAKAEDIKAHIERLKQALAQARSDLAHVLAAIRLFTTPEGGKPIPVYMNLTRLFPRHELPKLAREALESREGPMSTREIATYVIDAKGLDTGDRYLRKAITNKLIQVLRRWERERKVERRGKANATLVWQLQT